ncbi:hypothetical protein ANO14919_135670 [Xylariales sp. No.14919]|nr:hypothetical protein ANO14919_135670 [Xylariales sp. No.14919]
MGGNIGARRHVVDRSYLGDDGDNDNAEGEAGATDRKLEALLIMGDGVCGSGSGSGGWDGWE